MRSMSLLNFFRSHKLNNEFYICYNSNDIDSREYYPIYRRVYNEYRYYIPLTIPIEGYNQVVVSAKAATYIDEHMTDLDLKRLRISFYPWPEVILISPISLKNGYYDEWYR